MTEPGEGLDGDTLSVEQTHVIGTPEGDCPARVFTPSDGGADGGQWPGVIFFMDGYGLRDTLFDMGQRLANHGYVVLMPDMYYRQGSYQAATSDEIADPAGLYQRLGPWIASTDNLKAAADALAFIAFLRSRSDVLNGGMGVVGYCMGGGMALAAAGAHPAHISAAASFYGGRLATDAPASPHLLAPGMKARIYIAAADNDPFYPPEMNQRLIAAFDAAGVNYTVETYEGAAHGWTMPDFPVYDPAAAERHWAALARLFSDTLTRQGYTDES